MAVVCVVGSKESGKTRVAEALIGALVRRGLKVSALKKSRSAASLDPAAKDSARLKAAGAALSCFAGPQGSLLFSDPVDPDALIALLEVLSDVVVVEGYRDGPHPKVAVDDGDYKGVLARVRAGEEGWEKTVEAAAEKVVKMKRKTAAFFADTRVVPLNPFTRAVSVNLVRGLAVALRDAQGEVVAIVTRSEGGSESE